jgi:hypothetical protein
MRIATTCATLVATLSLAAPLPAVAAAHYHLAPQKRAAKYGMYNPVALTDWGLAAGTLSNTEDGTISAYFSEGKFFSDDDFCAAIGAPGATAVTGISQDAALTYTVGTCNGVHFSYLYDQATNTTTSVQYPGAISTFTYGVNANGMAVGEFIGPPTQGFSLVNGTYTPINAPGAYYTVALGVNAENAIFGNYYTSPSGYFGYVLAVTGQFTTINYPGSTFTQLAGLNSQNLAVGLAEDAANHQYAFAWQNGTYMHAPLPAGANGRATAVNENGDVAGWYIDTSGNEYGFVWQPSTNKLIKVKGPKNSKYITVTGINNTHAQITGSYNTPTTGQVGFIGTCTGTDCF